MRKGPIPKYKNEEDRHRADLSNNVKWYQRVRAKRPRDQFVPVVEAAARCGVSRRAVYNWIADDKIPHDSENRIPRLAFEDFIEKGKPITAHVARWAKK